MMSLYLRSTLYFWLMKRRAIKYYISSFPRWHHTNSSRFNSQTVSKTVTSLLRVLADISIHLYYFAIFFFFNPSLIFFISIKAFRPFLRMSAPIDHYIDESVYQGIYARTVYYIVSLFFMKCLEEKQNLAGDYIFRWAFRSGFSKLIIKVFYLPKLIYILHKGYTYNFYGALRMNENILKGFVSKNTLKMVVKIENSKRVYVYTVYYILDFPL